LKKNTQESNFHFGQNFHLLFRPKSWKFCTQESTPDDRAHRIRHGGWLIVHTYIHMPYIYTYICPYMHTYICRTCKYIHMPTYTVIHSTHMYTYICRTCKCPVTEFV
jgi:hypothetical protein